MNPRVRLDAADTIFFERELQQLLAGSFDPKYAQSKGRSFVGTGEMINEAVNTVRRESYDFKGTPKRIANPADDLPQAQVSGSEEFATMFSYGLAFSYSDQEIKAGRLAGKLPDQMRQRAVRRRLAMQVDEHIAIGDSDIGNLGLLNQTAGHDVTADLNGAWLTTATASEIEEDLYLIADKIANATSDVESTKRIIFPTLLMRKLTSMRSSVASDLTLMESFKRNRSSLDIQEWERSNLAGASSKHRIVAYDPAVENIRLLMSVEFAQEPPQRKNFAQLVNCYMRNGGVLLTYPKTLCYADTL